MFGVGTLTLHSGTTITGRVNATGSTLQLGRATNGTFDVSTFGDQFTVAAFKKMESGLWTLIGTNTSSTLVTEVTAGTLAVDGDLLRLADNGGC